MDPLITIAIPTYKRLSYLKEALASALLQTYSNIEIIIGQDPTPDGLDKEIKEWSTQLAIHEPRVKYFSNKKNLGLAGNWNAIASFSSGQYIIIIGDDDRLLPNCIEALMQGIKLGADVSFSNYFLIDNNVRRLDSSIENTIRLNRQSLKEGFLENHEKSI